METKAIQAFLRNHYSDQHLAALKAHCEDGKFSFASCCCFIGIPTADHALKETVPFNIIDIEPHYRKAKALSFAKEAEEEVARIVYDIDRRKILIELVDKEIAHRDFIKAMAAGCNFQPSDKSDIIIETPLEGVHA